MMRKAYCRGIEVKPYAWEVAASTYKRVCAEEGIDFDPAAWLEWYQNRYGPLENVYLEAVAGPNPDWLLGASVAAGEIRIKHVAVYRVTFG